MRAAALVTTVLGTLSVLARDPHSALRPNDLGNCSEGNKGQQKCHHLHLWRCDGSEWHVIGVCIGNQETHSPSSVAPVPTQDPHATHIPEGLGDCNKDNEGNTERRHHVQFRCKCKTIVCGWVPEELFYDSVTAGGTASKGLPILAPEPCSTSYTDDMCLGPCNWDNNKEQKCHKFPKNADFHPTLYYCEASIGKWYPIGPCDPKKRDWHIGCDSNGNCSYYDDDTDERLQLGRRGLPESVYADLHQLSTFCTSNTTLVKRLHKPLATCMHSTCSGLKCVNLDGYAACDMHHNQYILHGRHHRYVVHCSDPSTFSSCVHLVVLLPLSAETLDKRRIPNLEDSDENEHSDATPQVPLDLEVYDTRCQPDNDTVIERFDGEQDAWVYHYSCPPGACLDLGGRGACITGNSAYVVPGRDNMWEYKCASHVDFSTCSLQSGWPIEENRKSAAFQRNVYPTRCKPSTLTVQFYDGSQWNDLGECVPGQECSDNTGIASCKGRGRIVVFVVRQSDNNKLDSSTLYLATRCSPWTAQNVQYHDPGKDTWIDLDQCSKNADCRDGNDGSVCVDAITGARVVWIVVQKTVTLKQPGELPNSQNTVSQLQTRCDPDDHHKKLVQYFNNGRWSRFYHCYRFCQDLPDFAACREFNGKYVVPVPPTLIFERQSSFIFRCDTRSATGAGFQVFENGNLVLWGDCPDGQPCREVDGSAVCNVRGRKWSPGRETSIRARRDETTPPYDRIPCGHGVEEITGRSDQDKDANWSGVEGSNRNYHLNSYDPFGFDHQSRLLQRRADDGFIDDGKRYINRGAHLIEEGSQLIPQGDELSDDVYGSDGANHHSDVRRRDDDLADEIDALRSHGMRLIREGRGLQDEGNRVLGRVFGRNGTEASSVLESLGHATIRPFSAPEARASLDMSDEGTDVPTEYSDGYGSDCDVWCHCTELDTHCNFSCMRCRDALDEVVANKEHQKHTPHDNPELGFGLVDNQEDTTTHDESASDYFPHDLTAPGKPGMVTSSVTITTTVPPAPTDSLAQYHQF